MIVVLIVYGYGLVCFVIRKMVDFDLMLGCYVL